ncbi:RsbT antagonist protein RsbS [Azospirillaceae bacterium]
MRVPILRLGKVLLTSIQSDLTDEDAINFRTDVLSMIGETDAVGIVIDVTGLDVVDSFMARILNDTATSVRLLGGSVVVCGIRPAVALTLVEMGRQMIGAETALNLEQGVEKLHKIIKIGAAKRLNQMDFDKESIE